MILRPHTLWSCVRLRSCGLTPFQPHIETTTQPTSPSCLLVELVLSMAALVLQRTASFACNKFSQSSYFISPEAFSCGPWQGPRRCRHMLEVWFWTTTPGSTRNKILWQSTKSMDIHFHTNAFNGTILLVLPEVCSKIGFLQHMSTSLGHCQTPQESA